MPSFLPPDVLKKPKAPKFYNEVNEREASPVALRKDMFRLFRWL